MDGGFEEFKNLGFRGTEGLEVDFEVTRAHVETSPLWRLFFTYEVMITSIYKHFLVLMALVLIRMYSLSLQSFRFCHISRHASL